MILTFLFLVPPDPDRAEESHGWRRSCPDLPPAQIPGRIQPPVDYSDRQHLPPERILTFPTPPLPHKMLPLSTCQASSCPHRAPPTTTLPTNRLSQPTSWAPTLMAGHPLMRARAADYTGPSATGPGDHLWVPPPVPPWSPHPPTQPDETQLVSGRPQAATYHLDLA